MKKKFYRVVIAAAFIIYLTRSHALPAGNPIICIETASHRP